MEIGGFVDKAIPVSFVLRAFVFLEMRDGAVSRCARVQPEEVDTVGWVHAAELHYSLVKKRPMRVPGDFPSLLLHPRTVASAPQCVQRLVLPSPKALLRVAPRSQFSRRPPPCPVGTDSSACVSLTRGHARREAAAELHVRGQFIRQGPWPGSELKLGGG